MARGGARAHTNVDRPVAPLSADALRGSSDVGLFDSAEPMLFLVDGNNLLWRAAHGPRAPFDAIDGRDLTPLFRFITLLRRSLGTYGLFAECIVCFDGADAWSTRLDVDASYKGTRDYTSKDLSFMGWLPEIRAALEAIGITHVEVPTSEADDVIATLVEAATPRSVRILSTDRDYYQLIDPNTIVVNPKERPSLVTSARVRERYGVGPEQWCDLRALAGDPSDGIRGLEGIGMKKAAALLSGGRFLDDLRTTEPVASHFDDVIRWRDLIRLQRNIDTGVTLSGRPTPKLPSPTAVCIELGLVDR